MNQSDPIVINDDNQDKLNESPSTETSTESISTEVNSNVSPDQTPESVSTNLDSMEYKDDFQSTDQSIPSEIERDQSQTQNVVEPVTAPVATPLQVETPPLSVNLPVKTDNKMVSKTQKQYDTIINKANNIRKQFSKTRKTMPTWDDNKKHDWRNKISDTLIAVIRQAKNKHTLKHHHGKLKSMRNLFNHYLNSLSTSKQSAKNRREKKSKK